MFTWLLLVFGFYIPNYFALQITWLCHDRALIVTCYEEQWARDKGTFNLHVSLLHIRFHFNHHFVIVRLKFVMVLKSTKHTCCVILIHKFNCSPVNHLEFEFFNQLNSSEQLGNLLLSSMYSKCLNNKCKTLITSFIVRSKQMKDLSFELLIKIKSMIQISVMLYSHELVFLNI